MPLMDLVAVIIIITAALGTAYLLIKRHIPLTPAADNASETEQNARFGLAVIGVIGTLLHIVVIIGSLLVLWAAIGAPLPPNSPLAHEIPERPQVSIVVNIVPWVAWFGDVLVPFARLLLTSPWIIMLLIVVFILFLPRFRPVINVLLILLGWRSPPESRPYRRSRK